MKNMKIMEKEGKPLTILSESWSKMVREEKWMSMYQALDEMSQRFGFFRRAQEITLDAEIFSKAMTSIFHNLRLRKHFFPFSLILSQTI